MLRDAERLAMGRVRELLDFLYEAQLDRVGAFTCSPVDGAKANDLPGLAGLCPGDLAGVRITGGDECDLYGEVGDAGVDVD